jgi:hypothetical protein
MDILSFAEGIYFGALVILVMVMLYLFIRKESGK